ncbi:MAG TPA: bi-domain-containing oxidoreductase [Anaerolineae bacterium]|nr:bi-domain-containing oxidoreductase [Anaerolineae bacterium]
MKQILQNFRSGELRVEDVPAPMVKPGFVLARNLYSVVSAGTERHTVDFAQKNLLAKARARPDLVRKVVQTARSEGIATAYQRAISRLDDWRPLGYSSSASVLEVGEGVTNLAAGDVIACAGAGYANHAEIICVPQNLVAKAEAAVSPRQAAFATLGAIALEGIHRANLTPGECVGIIGLGLVGQLAALILKQYNFPVMGVDVNPAQVERARALGISATVTEDAISLANMLSDSAGLDAVLVTAATASSDPVRLAGELCRMRGRVSAIGLVGMDVPRQLYYDKQLDFVVSRSYGPGRYDPNYEEKGNDYPVGYVRWTENRNLKEFLRLLANGLDVSRLITHTVPLDDAPAVYDMILNNPRHEYFLGVLFEYPAQPSCATRIELPNFVARSGEAHETAQLGIIGVGQYAHGTLLPELKKIVGAQIRAVCSATGRSAQAEARAHGAAYATSDYRQILDDAAIDAVVIATRHNLHARIAVEAIQRGKHVLVEKPPALNEDELHEIVQAIRERSDVKFTVGYNRRFSPHARAIKHALEKLPKPYVMEYRVNAGAIEASSWVHDPVEGGGRIVGEACHFVDLLGFFAGALPTRVYAQNVGGDTDAARLQDNVSLQISFADGSTGSILYTSLGARSQPKERVEIFAGGVSLVLDNFKQTLIYGANVKKASSANQDKGQAQMLCAFLDAVRNNSLPPIPLDALIFTSLTTFDSLESLRKGMPVELHAS